MRRHGRDLRVEVRGLGPQPARALGPLRPRYGTHRKQPRKHGHAPVEVGAAGVQRLDVHPAVLWGQQQPGIRSGQPLDHERGHEIVERLRNSGQVIAVAAPVRRD